MKLYIAWSGDRITKDLDGMAMRDDAEGMRRAGRSIERGNDTLRSWLEASDGQSILIDSHGGRAQIQADHLHELEQMRDRYREIVGTSASMGIGSSMSEAEIALKAARLRGGNRALIYTPSMQEELEKGKDRLETLDKAEGPIKPTVNSPATPVAEQGEPDVMSTDVGDPEHTHAAKDFEQHLHDAAKKQDEEDQKQAQKTHQDAIKTRQQVAQVLQVMREQAPALEQIKGQAPKIYQSIMALTQQVIAMARLLNPDQSQPVQKSEELVKMAILDNKPGTPIKHPHFKLYSYDHLIPTGEKYSGYRMYVHHGKLDPEFPQEGQQLGVTLTHHGDLAGMANGSLKPDGLEVSSISLKDPHKKMGLGSAMYEALMTHAAHNGVKTVFGYAHSSSAHAAHSRLAAKHGMDYQATPIPSMANKPDAPYDEKYGPYSYTIKAEPPQGYVDDFSHVKAHVLRNDPHASSLRGATKFGLQQIKPEEYYWPKEPMPFDPNDPNINAGPPASDSDVARYASQAQAGSVPPAVFGVKRGIKTLLLDGKHRRAAAQVAGTPLTGFIGIPKVDKPEDYLEYKKKPEGGYGQFNHKTGDWVKAEDEPSKKKIEKGGLPMPKASTKRHLHLPVGTTIESTGRFKVMTPTGEKWKQGRMGVISSKQPETAAADWGHPTSSLRPSD